MPRIGGGKESIILILESLESNKRINSPTDSTKLLEFNREGTNEQT